MILTRIQQEENEDRCLAPYGMRSRASRGRAFPESEPTYRTAFQRDRDRILHTTAFRRLKHKTQVFIVTEGDYYRTRLTHTLEVAQIGRSIACALGANEDLVEGICLAHDLGHPPFGHAGELALSRLMSDHGGFDHNRQSYRIVTELERRYPEFAGLNLTWEAREGIVKHETEYDVADAQGYEPDQQSSMEAQIANVADELAYTTSDLDDGLRSGLIAPAQMEGIEIWAMLLENLGLAGAPIDELARHRAIRRLVGWEVSDVIQETDRRLREGKIDSVQKVRGHPQRIVAFSGEWIRRNRQLKDFLYACMYQHHRVVRMQAKAERFLAKLFDAYAEKPEMLPREVQDRGLKTPLPRVICDYIAGMTDRFALDEYNKLFDPNVLP
jgi:dGTPase